VHLSSVKVVGHMVESWYLSPQWTQSSKISRGLLRRGPGIGVPQPSDVNPVTVAPIGKEKKMCREEGKECAEGEEDVGWKTHLQCNVIIRIRASIIGPIVEGRGTKMKKGLG
jgi:hypothetical protein